MWSWIAAWFGTEQPIIAAIDESVCEGHDGAELFSRVWLENDPRSVAGDGLGPTYNERSCTACHQQGGMGGAGGNHANVALRVVRGRTEVVHRHGSHATKMSHIVASRPSEPPKPLPVPHTPIGSRLFKSLGYIDEDSFTAPARNTPALWGAGLVDTISDAEIEAVALAGDRDHPEITGRVSRDADGNISRFGWKGQTRSLAAFVEAACANELGLETNTVAQPGLPAPGPDIDDEQLSALVQFVASLPAPTQRLTPGVERGQQRFTDVGCGSCHRAGLGDVQGLYSDLLLHDMGERLADASTSYNGTQTAKATHPGAAKATEWRTPPLWGLADGAPYLHDGSAETVREAVAKHGGEASVVTRAYERLPEEDRTAIDQFLATLTAPSSRPSL